MGDAIAMSPLREAGPDVVAGAHALSRPVRWVHATELADIAPLIREGDLLLSTGIALPDTAAELEAYAQSLDRSGAAGLVVELGRRWHELPTALVDACERHDVVLIALAREVRFAAVAQTIGERILDSQVAELREAQRVHETFTELSLAEAGPHEILDAVQRLAGAMVVLESEDHDVLDFRSGPGDSTESLTDWQTRSRRIVVDHGTSWDESAGWLVTRVGRRGRGWGRLIVGADQAPSQRLVAVAERAAAALAMHRLHDRQRDTVVRRNHHELVLGLLTDPSSADLQHRCEVAGLPTARRHFVGLTLRPELEKTATRAAQLEDIITATVQAAHALRVPALVCEIEHDVRVLLSLPPAASAVSVVTDLVARVRRRRDIVAGMGREVTRLGDADRTLRESLHVAQSVRPGGPWVDVHRLEDVHLRGLLTMLADDDRLRLYVARELDPIRNYDERTGAGLLHVLRALITHPNSKSAAAASLHLSRPVFYDRLARLQRLLGVDLDDPDIRVSLHVALVADEVAPT